VLIETATGRIWNSNMTEVKTYSSVEAINPEIAVQLFPNPASDIVTLSFNLTETADVNIQVYTMDGKIVSEKSLNRINGEQFIPLDVHSLVSGNYLISVSANGKSFIKTLTVK
jgi:hypothetical protein